MKIRIGLLIILAFASVFFASATQARILNMNEGRVQFFIPDTWKNETAPGIVSSESPDGGVAIVFTLLLNDQLDQALAEAEASIVETVGTLVPNGDIVEFTVNGMPATMQKGSAQNGQTSVSLTMVLTPANRWLMIMYMGNRQQEPFWRKDLAEILNSVKPL